MRICRLVAGFPKLDKMEGFRIGTYYLTKAQVELGHDIVIVAGGKGRYKSVEKMDNFQIHRVFSYAPGYFHLPTLVYGLSTIKKIADLNPDIVHGHEKEPAVYSLYHKLKRIKIPFVLHSHGLHYTWMKKGIVDLKLQGMGAKGFFLKYSDFKSRIFYEKLAHKNADLIFAVSNAHKEEIHLAYGIPREKIVVTYNGVDTDLFKPISMEEARKRLGLPLDKKIFIMVGADIRKGRYIMLKAIEILRRKYADEFRILLVGGLKEDVRKVCRDFLFPELIIVGGVSYFELPTYYNASDASILPSLYESFGKVNIEAMACEKPVISTDVGGIPEVIGEKAGILIDPGDPIKLADAMERLMLDPKIRKSLGKIGRKKVLRNFTWDQVAMRVEEGYAKVVN